MRLLSGRFVAPLCLALSGAATISGCVVYDTPPPYAAQPAPSKFERAWNAALGAAGDTGLRVATADRARGLIQGTLGSSEVTIRLNSLADGAVAVEFNARGPKGQDAAAARAVSDAYERRMGR